MADKFRDGAFPRRIDRIVIRTEATMYVVGGFILMFFVATPKLSPEDLRSPFRTWIELISSQGAIVGLGLFIVIWGVLALWSVAKKHRKRKLEYVLFGFFLVRLYALLATVVTFDGIGDTRWIHHAPWVVIWAAYWLVSRLRTSYE